MITAPALPAPLACVASCLPEMMSPEARVAVERLVASAGPEGAVAALAAGGIGLGTRWTALMIAIESGDAGWLHVAALLRPGTSGATADSLLAALSTALRRNAPGVLRLMGVGIRPEDVCVPRITDARPIDLKVFEVHSRNALVMVSDPALRALRDRCLALIDENAEN